MTKRFAQGAIATLAGFSLLLIGTPAFAQGIPVYDNALLAQSLQEQMAAQVDRNTRASLSSVIATQLLNVMMVTANQLAYNTAVWVASGGPGETPLFTRDSRNDFYNYIGASVVASSLNVLTTDQVTDGVLGGFNVSVPDDPAYFIALRQGLADGYVRPQIDFNFSEVRDNYTSFIIGIENSDRPREEKERLALLTLAQSFDSNEFSNAFKIYSGVTYSAETRAQLEADEVSRNDGFLPQRDAISGQVNLPASFVQNRLLSALNRAQEQPFEIAQAQLGSDDMILQMGMQVVSVFGVTLASELLDRLDSGFFSNIASLTYDPFNPNDASSFSRDRAASAYRGLLAYQPLQAENYNIVAQLSSCPSSVLRNSRQLFSCAMDNSFAAAVGRASSGAPLTVKEAIDEGLINGNWAIIPSSDTARNQDARCYTYAFCYANLVKLRKARIIPVGFELVAESPYNSAVTPVTLKEAVDGYYSCNANGEADEAHPWCHLIDPNWVLKAPDTQCRMLASGQILVAADTAERAQECVDIQTCIAEDENGNCLGGYGYCVQEKNTWQFRGDSCPAEYASCLAFETREGDEVNYLVNTVDYGNCGEGDVGCLWRATEKRLTEDGTFEWPSIGDLAIADLDEDVYKNRLYLNASAEECDDSEGGCSELVVRGDTQSLNIISNPSFEIDENQDGLPDGWVSLTGALARFEDPSLVRSGSFSVAPGAERLRQYGIMLNQSRTYTLSFYATPSPMSLGSLTTRLVLQDENAEQLIDLRGTSILGDCSIASGGTDTLAMTSSPSLGAFTRYTCTFTAPALENPASRIALTLEFATSSVIVDDVQLEQQGEMSSFHAGYSAPTEVITAKIAPSYLGCTGAATDPAECANYARTCSPNDANCEAYEPTNGDPTINGITQTLDFCPAVCSGYESFKQEPTYYEPLGVFPLHFIPATGETCSASAVGCTEFTNLDTSKQEYFTYLRSCVARASAQTNSNSDGEAEYYTWEGSDTAGFQLKTWRLLESNISAPTHTSPAGVIESNPGLAPCTSFETTATGVICTDDRDRDGAIDSVTASCDEYADIFRNPDCREFYDSQGGIHYRLWSKTVTVSDTCSPYRKTELLGVGTDADANGMDDGEENCRLSGGYFDGANASCRYFGLESESELCSAKENGCRSYTGGTSRNSRVVLEELFESETVDRFVASSGSIASSTDSIAQRGRSLRLSSATVGTIATELDGQLFAGKTYTLSFWARGTGTIRVGLDTTAQNGQTLDYPFDSAIDLSPSWKRYSVGPVVVPADDSIESASLVLVSSQTAFIDTLVLREGEGDLNLIADSWRTPAQCDVNTLGQYVPQYHLGCSEYDTADGALAYIRSFSRLCSDDAVGCKAYYTTEESASTEPRVYNAVCENIARDPNGEPSVVTAPTDCYLRANFTASAYDTGAEVVCTIALGERSCEFDSGVHLQNAVRQTPEFAHIVYEAGTTVVSGDRDLYAIVEDEDLCNASGAGCTELGEFELSKDLSTVKRWTSTFLIDDPDTYDRTLCSEDALFCEAFDGGDNGTYYFKDPMAGTCEYKTDVTIGGQTFDGWIVTGTNNFCYGIGSCTGSTRVCSTDSDCKVNTGSCSASGSACTTDFDCGSTETCNNVSASTCTITQGTHIVGGEISGIWRNGDAQYDGAVATCPAQWNGCSEFQDPLDLQGRELYGETAGKNYNFINNSRIEDNDLIAAQRCRGLVSQDAGCALFNDTSIPEVRYSASASMIASANADVLFGKQKFDLVAPIDCSLDPSRTTITTPTGETVDLCARRCAYRNVDLITGGRAVGPTVDDVYSFSGSCFVDEDCQAIESDRGDLVEGSCLSTVTFATAPRTSPSIDPPTLTVPAPRLENDTNRVIKVNRDRVCSEWLTCSSSRTVWDQESGVFRTVCDDIELCSEYSGTGDASFCSKWNPDDPAVILDAERYINRDISWHGNEYSGYAIPESYPVQHLEQIDIAPPPGKCYLPNNPGSTINGRDCTTGGDAVCGEGTCIPADRASDFRLAFDAGQCSGTHGSSCRVGFCSVSNASCTTNSDCGAGEGTCSTGTCVNIFANTVCSEDVDCGVGTCSNGTCVEDTGSFCDLQYQCGGGATCIPSVAVSEGTCLNSQCVLTPNGQALTGEVAESTMCRAQPEATSPFPNKVVERWTIWDKIAGEIEVSSILPDALRGFADRGAVAPRRNVSGFGNVNLCAAGEECECSYKKVQTVAGQTAYIDDETELGRDGVEAKGICQGGEMAGSLCVTNEDCGTEAFGASCVSIAREDTFVGLEGYCLEYDTSININGDSSEQACLTWLPVDQLSGATDLNAKFRSAGYDGGETNYCAFVSAYVDLQPSVASVLGFDPTAFTGNPEALPVPRGGDWRNLGDIACLEQRSGQVAGGVSDEDFGYQACVVNNTHFTCPQGHYALVGNMYSKSGKLDDSFSRSCQKESAGDGESDCPFVCVPNSAVVPETGEDCYEAIVRPIDHVSKIREQRVIGDLELNTKVYYFPEAYDFDLAALGVQRCVAKGIEVNQGSLNYSTTMGEKNPEAALGDANKSWYNYRQTDKDDYYLGCKEAVVVDDGNGELAAPRTDRLLNPETTFQYPARLYESFRYTTETRPSPFGVAESLSIIALLVDPTPSRLAACEVREGSDAGHLVTAGIASCPAGTIEAEGANLASPQARPSVRFDFNPVTRVLKAYRAYVGVSGGSAPATGTDEEACDPRIGCPDDPIATTPQATRSDAVYLWKNLFARGLGGKRFMDGLSENGLTFYGRENPEFSERGMYGKVVDVIDNAYSWDERSLGKPPKIWSVDTTNCHGTLCEEGNLNALTVNQKDFGTLTGSRGFFRANLKFFMGADKDQLPIRRVIVDWGDGSDMNGSPTTDNYFKNHRGLVEDSTTQSKCETDAEWGMTSESCDPNFMNYSHVYTCSEEQLQPVGGLEVCVPGQIYPNGCRRGNSCVYTPRVHIRDNWGWCASSVEADGGLWDGGGLGSTSTANACNYLSKADAWIYYDGEIIITP